MSSGSCPRGVLSTRCRGPRRHPVKPCRCEPCRREKRRPPRPGRGGRGRCRGWRDWSRRCSGGGAAGQDAAGVDVGLVSMSAWSRCRPGLDVSLVLMSAWSRSHASSRTGPPVDLARQVPQMPSWQEYGRSSPARGSSSARFESGAGRARSAPGIRATEFSTERRRFRCSRRACGGRPCLWCRVPGGQGRLERRAARPRGTGPPFWPCRSSSPPGPTSVDAGCHGPQVPSRPAPMGARPVHQQGERAGGQRDEAFQLTCRVRAAVCRRPAVWN